MGTDFIIAQVLGAIALVIVMLSYFRKEKTTFLAFQLFANIFYASAFCVLLEWAAGVVTFISALRCITFYYCQKKNFKYTYIFLILFIIMYIVATIIFFSDWFDLIPLIASIIFTIVFFIKDLKLTRYLTIPPNAIWVVYNIVVLAYTSALLDFLEIIATIIAIINARRLEKKEIANKELSSDEKSKIEEIKMQDILIVKTTADEKDNKSSKNIQTDE